MESRERNLDSRDFDFWERESWREAKWEVSDVNSCMHEDRIVFWASRSLKNFSTVSVLMGISVAIPEMFGGNADDVLFN